MAEGISIAAIQRLVAAHYGIGAIEMRSDRQDREAARPRQVAMYLARRLTPHSLAVIGRAFGGRDHATVMYAIREVEKRMAGDPATIGEIRGLLVRAGGNGEPGNAVLRGACRALGTEARDLAKRVDDLVARIGALEKLVAETAP